MAKISFNAQALGVVINHKGSDVGHTIARCAPEPIVIPGIRIETVLEGLRLADIESLGQPEGESTGDVDP